jgi:hypothetical protein
MCVCYESCFPPKDLNLKPLYSEGFFGFLSSLSILFECAEIVEILGKKYQKNLTGCKDL